MCGTAMCDGAMVVSEETTATLFEKDGEQRDLKVCVTVEWRCADPFAVTLRFHCGNGPVEWVVALELLRDVLDIGGLVGDGDAQFVAMGWIVVDVLLDSPSGSMRFRFDRDVLNTVVDAADDHSPPWEPLDPKFLDAEIRYGLGGLDWGAAA